MKQKYRKKLVQRYLREMESTMQDTPRSKLNVLDSIHYISAAWDELEALTIKNCFRKARFLTTEDTIRLPPPLDEDIADTEFEEFAEYFTVDDGIATTEFRSLEQLVDDAAAQDKPEGEDSDEETEDTPPTIPSAAGAMQSIYNVRSFVSSVED